MAATSALGYDHFHPNLLKRHLIVNQIKQSERSLIRHVVAAQLDASGFACQLRVRSGHFSIKQKRNVSVEFFLELMELLIRTIPRSRLVHGEKNLIGLFVVREKIDDRWVDHACHRIFVIVIVLVLVIAGRH